MKAKKSFNLRFTYFVRVAFVFEVTNGLAHQRKRRERPVELVLGNILGKRENHKSFLLIVS